MFELSRVRLFSVGPPGARYQDVCLDLRGVGAPVPGAPAQADLFAPDDIGGVARRPSPASVLFLENGGGKSVLLKLVFSVLLPGRRQVVGTTSTDVLAKFVLGEDVAHVACEWMHTTTGALVVTGKVSEWPGHVVSSDAQKLADAWYSFRAGPGFGLDDLPFTVEGRRVTMSAFKDRLHERHRDDPACELVWETGHRDWTRHLVDVGLDPELFRYQRAMNAGEGEAAEAFSFPSDEAFVDFLLRAVLDPEEPQNLADLVAGYATKIAQRSELETERAFVEGTLDRLAPLAEADRAARTARDAESTAQRIAAQLAAAIVRRKAEEDERADAAAAVVESADAAERVAAREERRCHEITVELRRLVAGLRMRDAEVAEAEARRERDAAQELLDAWQAVEPVLRHRLATAEAQRLRRVVDAEQERARPALRARQAAAAALATALRATIEDADTAARAAADDAAAAEKRADTARELELERTRDAAAHRAAVDAAQVALAGIRDATAAAVNRALLGIGDDVAAAAAGAADVARSATAALAACAAELGSLRRTRQAADARRGAARRADDAGQAAHTVAVAAHTEAAAVRNALASEPRLAELLGVDDVAPDSDTAALRERLAAALAAGEQQRTVLLADQARDQRALRALGEGGLLPEPAEIEDVLRVLDGAGITAWSGWRYLTMLPAGERASVVERLPHLVSGVLLNNPADAPRAREELEQAKLLPCAVVTVGVTAAVVPDAAAPGVELVVPPNPAMVDEDAAAAVREELTAATRDRSAVLEELAARFDADRDLTARLRAWEERRPTLAELADAVDDARTRLAAQAAESVAAEAEVAGLDARADALEAEQPRRDAEAAAARERAARLAELAAQVGHAGEHQERVRAATADAARADERAAAAREEGRRNREDGDAARHTQGRHLALAERARAELAELPLDAADVSDEADTAPLSVLRGAYERARASYAAAEVGADLSGRLELAEREARSAQGPVDGLDAPARARADVLLRSPEGADPASRRGAADQARRTLAHTADRLQKAATAAEVARRDVAGFTAPPRSVEPYGVPESVEDGEDRVDRADRDRRAAEVVAGEARDRTRAARDAHRAATASAEGFGHVVGSLDDAAPGDADTVTFAGTVDDAVAASATARTAGRDAAVERARVERDVRAAVDAVAQFAQEPRFGTLASPVRRHISGIARAEMPGLAAEWTEALRPRLRSLDDDLASIGRHRSGIVTRLSGMVTEALRTLRLAQRLSELPDGLEDWSGQQFLRIRFDDVDDAVLRHELGEVVDRSAEQQIAGKGAGRRDGLALLLLGVRAAMPKGVRVEMLKPDAVLRTERLRVSQIRDVFSGGQQLTAAIVLYCTMAALRAHQRGAGKRPHAGVLFLDNPIGRASAGYLLELQFGVARALGVQLVYTTGLFDAGALSTFPLVIRLRNDADLRAGRKYLSVDDRIGHALDGLGDPDGSGRLSASRVFRRPG